MSETNQAPENRNCKVCGKPLVDTGMGGTAHAEGGEMAQRCKNPSCGWSGSQVGKFTSCPRCGDSTQLADDHMAS